MSDKTFEELKRETVAALKELYDEYAEDSENMSAEELGDAPKVIRECIQLVENLQEQPNET